MKKRWPAMMQLLGIGFYVAFSLVVPTGIGFWLGRRLGHEIMFPLIGLGIGTIIMVYGVYRMVQPFLREAKKEGQRERFGQALKSFLSSSPFKERRDKSNG